MTCTYSLEQIPSFLINDGIVFLLMHDALIGYFFLLHFGLVIYHSFRYL
jgi:hypothetical protein